jgi:hypothetical protein
MPLMLTAKILQCLVSFSQEDGLIVELIFLKLSDAVQAIVEYVSYKLYIFIQKLWPEG